jgi:hypothetical protein
LNHGGSNREKEKQGGYMGKVLCNAGLTGTARDESGNGKIPYRPTPYPA